MRIREHLCGGAATATRLATAGGLVWFLAAVGAVVDSREAKTLNLLEMDLEELVNVEITVGAASRPDQSAPQVPHRRDGRRTRQPGKPSASGASEGAGGGEAFYPGQLQVLAP
jgi:hypothetical protein